MEDCIFCKIANGEISTNMVYEDELVAAFNDTNPIAPVHILIVPKAHIASALELDSANSAVVGHIFEVAGKIARQQGFAEDGFRLINNCGRDGGQTVGHLHFHLLAGKTLGWEQPSDSYVGLSKAIIVASVEPLVATVVGIVMILGSVMLTAKR